MKYQWMKLLTVSSLFILVSSLFNIAKANQTPYDDNFVQCDYISYVVVKDIFGKEQCIDLSYLTLTESEKPINRSVDLSTSRSLPRQRPSSIARRENYNGRYNVSVKRLDQDIYRDEGLGLTIITSLCLEFALLNEEGILIWNKPFNTESIIGEGKLFFLDSEESCDVKAVYN